MKIIAKGRKININFTNNKIEDINNCFELISKVFCFSSSVIELVFNTMNDCF